MDITIELDRVTIEVISTADLYQIELKRNESYAVEEQLTPGKF